MLAGIYAELFRRCDRFRMIIAPRHVERVDEITAELDRLSIGWCRYASSDSDRTESSQAGLVLVDTLGQLNDIYQIADLAFVGASAGFLNNPHLVLSGEPPPHRFFLNFRHRPTIVFPVV